MSKPSSQQIQTQIDSTDRKIKGTELQLDQSVQELSSDVREYAKTWMDDHIKAVVQKYVAKNSEPSQALVGELKTAYTALLDNLSEYVDEAMADESVYPHRVALAPQAERYYFDKVTSTVLGRYGSLMESFPAFISNEELRREFDRGSGTMRLTWGVSLPDGTLTKYAADHREFRKLKTERSRLKVAYDDAKASEMWDGA